MNRCEFHLKVRIFFIAPYDTKSEVKNKSRKERGKQSVLSEQRRLVLSIKCSGLFVIEKREKNVLIIKNMHTG